MFCKFRTRAEAKNWLSEQTDAKRKLDQSLNKLATEDRLIRTSDLLPSRPAKFLLNDVVDRDVWCDDGDKAPVVR